MYTLPVWPWSVLQQTRSVGPKLTGVRFCDLAYPATVQIPHKNQPDLRNTKKKHTQTKKHCKNYIKYILKKKKGAQKFGHTVRVEQRTASLFKPLSESVDSLRGRRVALFELRNRHSSPTTTATHN